MTADNAAQGATVAPLPSRGSAPTDYLDGGCVGRTVVSRQVEASTRRLLAFAAGIGAVEDAFLDDARSGGIVAAPGYHCSFEWPCILSDGYLDAIGITRQRLLQTMLHGFQDTHFLAPIRPDRSYRSSLRIVGMRQIAPGCLVVSEITTEDELDATTVTRSLYGSIFRGAQVTRDHGMLPMPTLGEESAISSPDWQGHVDVPRTLPQVYTACSDIWNPIHTERAFALGAGLPDIILHGVCTWTLAGLALMRRHAPQGRLKRLAGRFSSMVLLDQRLTVESRRLAPGRHGFAVRTEDGKVAVSHGLMETVDL